MNVSFQFEAARDALRGEPKKRKPKRIRTLGSLELETKVELVTPDQVTEMIDRIRRLSDGICKASTREQFHTVFADNDDGYHGLVLVEGSDYVGIRSKNTGELITTPSLGLPTFIRNETVVAPTDAAYVRSLRNIFLAQKIGSFDKRCADAAFWIGNNSYTATVSIVDEPDRREGGCYQLELEFDGHKEGTTAPEISEILLGFEQAYRIAFGESAPSTRTKLEWLAQRKGQPQVVPHYTPIAAEVSKILAQETRVSS